MNCKFCDSPLDEGSSICPSCGVDNEALEEANAASSDTAADAMTETPADSDAPASPESPDADLFDDETLYDAAAPQEPAAEPGDEPAPKKAGKGLLIGLSLVALAAVAALVLAFTGILGSSNQDGVDPTDVNMVDKDGVFIAHDFVKASMTEQEAAAVVATAGKWKLTNNDLTYYYWQQYSNLYNSMGMYISMVLDPEQSLAVQMYDETHSWQDILIQGAISSFHHNAALGEAAAKEKFTLSQERADYLDTISETLESDAAANGFDSADALLQSVYGPYATLAGYVEYANDTMLASSYMEQLFEAIEYTDEDITAYFDTHPEEFEGATKDDPNMVNVRHILIQPQADQGAELGEDGAPVLTDENWADAEARANEIYRQWQDDGGGEDAFAALAAQHSADGSAQTGGMIEDIFPGQTVTEFNDWCFDTARQPGDHTVVKTQFGFHIMYFSSVAEHPQWFVQAETKLSDSLRRDMLDQLVSKTKLKVDYTKAILLDPNQAAPADDAEPSLDTTPAP